MIEGKDYRVVFTEPGKADLVEAIFDERPAAGEVTGQNLVAMISTGSERGGFTQRFRPDQYPMQTGSSSVARVIRVGEGVTGLQEGDLFFHGKHHARYVRVPALETVPVPLGLEPEKALFGRYAAVSMTSIHRMGAKAPDRVLVTGLGLVGLMCAQVLGCLGFEAYAVDPSADRRSIALEAGLIHVADEPGAWPELAKGCGALMECSGNENALRAAIPYLRPGSDAFQVGVPWKKNGDWDAHSLLHELFYAYVSLHGGWEWFLPKQSTTFEIHSSQYHIEAAMRMIATGRMQVVPGMYELRDPADCGRVYEEIASHRMSPAAMLFDWRRSGF